VVAALASGQTERGQKVTVVSLSAPADDVLASRIVARGASVTWLPKKPGIDPTLLVRLRRLFRELAPDVVHTHNPLPLVYGAPVASLLGVPTLHTKHGPHPDAPHRLALRRLAARSVDIFVAVSSDTAQAARRFGEAEGARLRVVPNGLDLDAFASSSALRREIREGWGVDDDVQVIGTVGRLEPVKDHEGLVRALAPVLGPARRLVIAGGGSRDRAIGAAAEALGVAPWVRLLGERSDVARVLQGFDAFVLASRTEGQPLAVIEAMAANLPVVSTRVGGIAEAFGTAALLVPPGDPSALAKAISSMLDAPEERRALAARGHTLVHRRHSVTAMLDAYDALYAEARSYARA